MKQQAYKDKWSLILGGSSGLGLATAQKLGAEGMHCCIIHRTRRSALPPFETAIETMRAHGTQVKQFNLDATQADNRQLIISDLIENIGKHQFKVLVHSIARGELKTFL